VVFALCNPNIMDLLQGEQGWGAEKGGFRRTKALISLKRGKIAPRIRSNRKSYTRFRLVPNDLGWPWSVVMHFVSKHVRLSSELTVKIWMKIQYTVSDEDVDDVAKWLYSLAI